MVGDPNRLRQIIVNLVGNAIKFTSEGEVVVEVATDAVSDESVKLRFSVRDTGVGIPPDKQKTIFDAFSQADTSTSRRYGGTGLGLAISTQLVAMMGGEIGVESEVGVGATFHFTLILKVSNAASRQPRVMLKDLLDLPVLVVDDNRTNRLIYTEILSAWQMKPHAVESGPKAIDELDRAAEAGEPYQLVLLDCMMPDMDGFEVAKEVRKRTELDDCTLVMLTSAGRPDDIRLSKDLGIERCLTKPVKQSTLLNAVQTLFGAAAVPRSFNEQDSEQCVPEKGRRILLAEDGVVNQRVACGLLERRGHEVVVAGDGKQALETLAREQFDLILMDVHMPEMDGLEATRAIREQEKSTNSHIPIIAMTASAMKGDRDLCREAGMDGFVSKPVDRAELFTVVESVPSSSPGSAADANSEDAQSSRRATQSSETPASPTSIQQAGTDDTNNTVPLIDWDRALQEMPGGNDLARQLAELLMEEGPRLIAQMREGFAAEDSKLVQRAAHTFKSSVGIFAATELEERGERIEFLAKEKQLNSPFSRFTSSESWGINGPHSHQSSVEPEHSKGGYRCRIKRRAAHPSKNRVRNPACRRVDVSESLDRLGRSCGRAR